MKNPKVSPAQMDLICNIQAMKNKINPSYDQFSDFKNLAMLSEDQLRRLQERLIPEYNKTFTVSI
jgi:hypothetical protein